MFLAYLLQVITIMPSPTPTPTTLVVIDSPTPTPTIATTISPINTPTPLPTVQISISPEPATPSATPTPQEAATVSATPEQSSEPTVTPTPTNQPAVIGGSDTDVPPKSNGVKKVADKISDAVAMSQEVKEVVKNVVIPPVEYFKNYKFADFYARRQMPRQVANILMGGSLGSILFGWILMRQKSRL